jgi:hypothetical protein
MVSARLAPEPHIGVSARCAALELADEDEDALDEDPDADPDDAAADADERAADAAEEAPDAMELTAEEAPDAMEPITDEREAEADEGGAVAVAEEPETVPVRLALVAVEDALGETANSGLVVRTSVALVGLRKPTVYCPGLTSWGKRTVTWLFCVSTLLAMARPPAKVALLSALKSANVKPDGSEEVDVQVIVTFWPVVAVEGTCRLDSAAAVAANARAMMEEKEGDMAVVEVVVVEGREEKRGIYI